MVTPDSTRGCDENPLEREIVGLVPAGGHARRIAPLPCSKELFPVGFQSLPGVDGVRPKAVGHYLLEKMRFAGVTRAFIVLRNGKWDIPAYFGDGAMLDMHLAYLVGRLPFGAPYTLDAAYPFVRNAVVTFGFPDILFQPDDGYEQLLTCQADTGADIVLGVFPASRPEIMEMIDVDPEGRVHDLVIRPLDTRLRFAWIFAVWTPAFTRFQHDFLETFDGGLRGGGEELSVGGVIRAAIRAGLPARAVRFPAPTYLDIGAPSTLVEAVRGGCEPVGPDLLGRGH
jgi:glucose-1-phosphate thymidylyltransferase